MRSAPYNVTYSIHGQPCIELQDAPPTVHGFLRGSVLNQWTDSPAYQSKRGAYPFLQGQDKNWTLVEFWGSNYADFVTWLNLNVPV